MKWFRTQVEPKVGRRIEATSNASPDPVEVRLENFPKYVRRQQRRRLLESGKAPAVFRRIGARDRISRNVGDRHFLRAANGLDAGGFARTVALILGIRGVCAGEGD